MRTEDDLREVLHSPPDLERTDRLARRITAAIEAPTRRRSPVLAGLVAAVAMAVAVAVGLTNLPRDAVPTEPTPTPSAVPTPGTNERVAGNWRLTHRVDLPPGWTIKGRGVGATSEGTTLRAPSTGAARRDECTVMVFGVGEPRPRFSKDHQSVTVSGRPGYADTPIPDGESRVTWEYRDNGWASVTCSIDDGFATVLDIAQRVVFTPTVLRVPVRLTWVPDGFRVVSAGDLGFQPGPYAGWVIENAQKDAHGYATVQIATTPPGETELRAGRRGGRSTVIGGHPAVIADRDGAVQLKSGKYVVLLTAIGYPADRPEWPSGRIALLTQLAESLELAPDLGDRATWFDAEQAVPN